MTKLLSILFSLTIGLVLTTCVFDDNPTYTEESSEPIIETFIETFIETEAEIISETVSPFETEPTIETAPGNDYVFYDVPFNIDTQKEIIKICSEYGFSYELILGIISVESSFRPGVLGDGGNSFGLMQIQPRWWGETMEREGVTNLLDPLQNIRCGCAILKELKDKYGTEYRALQAYNTGRPDTNNGYAEKVYRRIGELVIYGG